MDEEEDSLYYVLESSRFWVQKVLVPILLCLGIAGNTLTIMVLTRRRMRSSTNIYLSALAIADIFHLIFGFLLSFTHYKNIHDRRYELYWRFYGLTHWLCDAANALSSDVITNLNVSSHIIQPPSYDIIKREGVDRYLQHQLKTILANCTNKPHIIYVPISPELLNVSTVRDTTTGEIQNRTKRQYSETIEESLTGVSEPSKFLESIFPTKDSFQVLTETRGEKVIREAINGLEEPEEADNAQGNAEYIDVKDAARDGYDVKELGMMENSTDSSFENNEENSQDIQMTVDSNNITYKTYCCLKNLTIDVESTDLSKNMNYLNFIYWYSALFFGIIPLVLIATFNCFLIRAVYLSQQLRRVMTNSTENTMFSNERRITIILIGIVISFLVCNTPTSAHLIYYHFHKVSTPRENNIMRILGNIFNLMLMLNAPCNFLIYCVLSKKFRQTFKKIFCERRKKKQLDGDTLLLASTRKYRTPRNIEVTIYLFNRGKYVNTYQFCTRTNHLRSCFFSQRNTN
ncbi:unnamed protein product [Acanthoscelides obtectus]|uniref:G-protein coupled receptors family 1 profile domain-containing protein n=1 Tax=Acanthoscelides obtectus TaxID=200917 RepID=A0A9P0NPI9_ACAOB|nr:unnamed protein product [Acanthoscelides obtectus]CAK1624921.1 Sex peptide receptor [Acanthoscelides obtectus]